MVAAMRIYDERNMSFEELADVELSETEGDGSIWLNADEMADNTTAPQFLINNILETNTHGLIAGSSQSFKSFCVLKMAHSICTGNEFFGHDVYVTGKVLYICGEGLGAFGRRIKAIKIVEGGFNNNFYVLNRPLFIDKVDEIDWLRQQIEEIKPVFVVLDTFSSLAIGTKENVNEDVARVLRMVHDCCADAGASSIIVHHYGKNIDNGSRGASAFSANVDFEIAMARKDGLNAVMSCKKTKDGDFFEDIEILAHVVDIGLIRQDGGTTSSLVLKKVGSSTSLTPRQESALNAIKAAIHEDGIFLNGNTGVNEKHIKDAFNVVFESEGANKRRLFGKIIPSLLKKGVLFEKDGLFYV